MPGRHHNIFYYYRGPSAVAPSAKDEDRYQQQVEDNSTKALVNVLDLGGRKLVCSFVERFAPALAVSWPAASVPELFLQGGPQPVPQGVRLLLGISLLGEIDGPVTPTGEGSRIDAAIVIPDAGMLAIEVKVVDDLDGAQLARHARRWGIPGAPLLARWADVWRWARGERAHNEGAPRFLLDQLCEYLEILGFAPWAGFRAEDFAFFASPTLEQRSILKSRMSGAWERVLGELDDAERELLGRVHSNRLPLTGDTPACAQTNRGQPVVNLTLELNAHELQLNVVGWTQPRAGQLITWLHSPASAAVALDLRGFEVVLFARRAMKDHAGNPFWQRASEKEVDRLDVGAVGLGSIAPWFDTWQGRSDRTWEKLAVHIRRTYSRQEVLSAEEAQVERLVADVRRLLPVLRSINRLD